MKVYQKDRIYSLIVGTKEDAVEINNLQIKFDVKKTSSNKDAKNSASIEIYNLSEDRRKRLEEPYVQVSLAVGYASTGLVNLFTGQVVNISSGKVKPFLSKKSGGDIITKLDIDEFYEELNGRVVSKIVPAGNTVGDAINSVAESVPEVIRVQMAGEGIKKQLPDGYPLAGSPKEMFDEISLTYDLDWQIDQSTLYISDRTGSFTESTDGVPLLGQMSGLLEAPEFINEEAKRLRRKVSGKPPATTEDKKNALKFKILMNAAIVAGSYVKLDFADLTGYYKVSEVKHKGDFRGQDWYSELRCEEKIG